MRHRAIGVLPTLLAAGLLAHVVVASLPLEVVQLTGATFEHKTQASTGQTTGHWCVLFLNKTADSQHQLAAEDAWVQLASDEEKAAIFAEVDVASASALARRFSLTQLPAVILFRDRLMYRFPRPLDREPEGVTHQMQDFVAGGFQEQEGSAVPSEASILDRPRAYLLGIMEAAPDIAFYGGIVSVVVGIGMFLGVGALAILAAKEPSAAPQKAGAAKASSSSSGSGKGGDKPPLALKTRAVQGAQGERLEPVVESPLAKVPQGASPFGASDVQQQPSEDKKGL